MREWLLWRECQLTLRRLRQADAEVGVFMGVRSRRCVVAGLAFALTCGGVLATGPAWAEPVDLDEVPQQSRPLSEREAMSAAEKSGEPVEVSELTTDTTRVVADPVSNGFVAEVSANPVRMERDGGWVDIDTSWAARGDRWVTSATPTEVSVGGSDVVRIQSGEREFAFTWPTALPAPQVRDDLVIWENVAPDIDLVVRSGAEGARQFLVVRTREAAADPLLRDLRFGIDAPGLTISAGKDGLAAKTAAGESAFSSNQFLMWEAPTEVTGSAADVSQAAVLAPVADGAASAEVPAVVEGSQLKLLPDRAMLDSAETQFPVVIDPEVKAVKRTNWAMVWSDGQEFWNSSSEHARVGYDGWSGMKKSRAFYTMAMSSFEGATISSAKFAHAQIHSALGQCDAKESKRPSVQIWRTGAVSSSVTWSNQPVWQDELDEALITHGSSQYCSGYTRTEWDVKDGVQAAADAGWGTLTLGLKSEDEGDRNGWRQFDNTSDFPVLTVTYNRTPTVPGAVTIREDIDYQSAKFLTDTTPTLDVTVKDPDGGDVKAIFIVNPVDPEGSYDDRTFVSSPYVSSGGKATKVLPSGILSNGNSYDIYARASDGALDSVSGPSTRVTVDTSAPAAPAMSKVSPSDNPAVGETIQLKLDSSSSDAARYVYGVNTDTPSTSVTPSSLGGASTVSFTVPAFGPNYVTAYSVDRAGNRSGNGRFEFKVDGTLPAHRWRLDSNGTDTRTATSPGSTAVDLTVPAGTQWTEGRSYFDAAGGPWVCADKAFQTSSAVKTLVSSADPINSSLSTSVSAWVKPSSLNMVTVAPGREASAVTLFTGEAGAISIGYRSPDSSTAPTWFAAVDDDTTFGSRKLLVTTQQATAGNWTHLVLTYSSTSQIATLYVNGVKVAERGDISISNANRLMIGGAPASSTYVPGELIPWTGAVDEVRLYAGVLDGGQVTQSYNEARDPEGC